MTILIVWIRDTTNIVLPREPHLIRRVLVIAV